MSIVRNSIVTLDLGTQSSNTFIVDTIEETTVLLSHPLAPGVLTRVPKNLINTVGANIKDSTERSIDYANNHKSCLNRAGQLDLESLGIIFALKRKLTNKQKETLASLCGYIAQWKLENNVWVAIETITRNKSLLNDFNLYWFDNFQDLFTGRQKITSDKQRKSIFNMAGYVLAELENPTATSYR